MLYLCAIARKAAKGYQNKVGRIFQSESRNTRIKIEKNENEEEIRMWSAGVDSQAVIFKENLAKIECVIKKLNREALKQTTQDEAELIQVMKDKQFEKEMQFEEEKFQRRVVYEKKIEEARQAQISTKEKSSSNTKLPKLVISKFNGELTAEILEPISSRDRNSRYTSGNQVFLPERASSSESSSMS